MKQVDSGGMVWKIHSRNERSTVQQGRYFFAGRCKPGAAWVIVEMDADLATAGKARELSRLSFVTTNTRELSGFVETLLIGAGPYG